MSDQIDQQWAANLRAKYGIVVPFAAVLCAVCEDDRDKCRRAQFAGNCPVIADTPLGSVIAGAVVSCRCNACRDDPYVCGTTPDRHCPGVRV